MEEIEELKKKLVKRITYKDGSAEEIIKIVEKEFYELQIKYEELCGKDARFFEYIQEKADELKAYAIEQNKKKNRLQIENIENIVKMIERSIEEKGEEKLERRDAQNRKNIENITRNSRAVSRDFLQVFEDSLSNINDMANENLNARQVDQSTIEQMVCYMKGIKLRSEEKIFEAFQDSDKKLIDELFAIYNEYVEYKDENKKSKREKLTDLLDVKISLEEQKENADRIVEKIEKEKKESKENEMQQDLPSDII